MLFNSLEFLIFFLIFIVLWRWLKAKNSSRWLLITIASIVFYAYWDWRFVFLILFSGVVDYFAGILLVKSNTPKKVILITSLLVNLSLLSVFKYASFFSDILQRLFSILHIELNLVHQVNGFSIILPLGISFYTFQSMSYTIDIYRGRLKPTYNILHFFSYLLMFPQLVAGPIVRAKDLLQQLEKNRVVSKTAQWHAFKMVVYGLFRKVVIADNLAYLVDIAYQDKTGDYGSLFWWTVTIAFSFQIYCDFSGYSLIARGLAKYMGYHFKMNFNHPYLAVSFRDFWQRWHISLSTWFRDYVYIPLGGSRNGTIRSIFSVCLTMLISGLWHGANYTFLIWGGLHALFLLVERFVQLKGFKYGKIAFVFILVNLSWVYFRSDSVAQAHKVLYQLFDFSFEGFQFFKIFFDNYVFLFLAIAVELAVLFKSQITPLVGFKTKNKFDIILVAVTIMLIVCFRGEGQQFIYFQF